MKVLIMKRIMKLIMKVIMKLIMRLIMKLIMKLMKVIGKIWRWSYGGDHTKVIIRRWSYEGDHMKLIMKMVMKPIHEAYHEAYHGGQWFYVLSHKQWIIKLKINIKSIHKTKLRIHIFFEYFKLWFEHDHNFILKKQIKKKV